MKHSLLLFIVLVLFSCSEKEVSLDTLVNRNGLLYEVNKEKPFTGKVTALYENQQLKTVGYYQKGLKHKEWKEFQENGQLLYRKNYSKGMLNGEVEEFYFDGVRKELREYINDSLNGSYQSFYSSGEPYIKGTYINNMKEGLWVNANRNGSRIEEEYRQDLRDGIYREINASGSVTFSGTYSEGKKEGLFEVFNNDNGAKIRETSYENDIVIAEKVFDTQGNITFEAEYPGMGTWYDNATKRAEASFTNQQNFQQQSLKMWIGGKELKPTDILYESVWKGPYFNSGRGRYREYYTYRFNSNGRYYKQYFYSRSSNPNANFGNLTSLVNSGRWEIYLPTLPQLGINISAAKDMQASKDAFLNISEITNSYLIINGEKVMRE